MLLQSVHFLCSSSVMCAPAGTGGGCGKRRQRTLARQAAGWLLHNCRNAESKSSHCVKREKELRQGRHGAPCRVGWQKRALEELESCNRSFI